MIFPIYEKRVVVSTVRVSRGIYDTMVFPIYPSFHVCWKTIWEIDYLDLEHIVSKNCIQALKNHILMIKQYSK